MKPFIFGIAAFLLAITCYCFTHDFNLNKQQLVDLKTVCEEASVAGTLFYFSDGFSSGSITFNQEESTKAIEAIIISMLRLDENMNPTQQSYWADQVSYKVHFFDDSNTTYPYLFVDPDTSYTHLIKSPTVVVTINAGKGRYSLQFLKGGPDNIRSAAHTWEVR